MSSILKSSLEELIQNAMKNCFGDKAEQSFSLIEDIIKEPMDTQRDLESLVKLVEAYCRKNDNNSSPHNFDMRLLCFTELVYILKKCSPVFEEIKIGSIEELRRQYPSLTKDISDQDEPGFFLEYVNTLRMAFRIFPKKCNKKLLVLNISSRLERLSPDSITLGGSNLISSGKKRRIEVYYLEGGKKPIPRKPKQTKAREGGEFPKEINTKQTIPVMEESFTINNNHDNPPLQNTVDSLSFCYSHHEHNHEVRNGKQTTLLLQNDAPMDGFLYNNHIHSSIVSHLYGQRYNPSMAQATMSNNTDNGLSRKKARGNDDFDPSYVFVNNIINNTIPPTDFQPDAHFPFDRQPSYTSMNQATISNPLSVYEPERDDLVSNHTEQQQLSVWTQLVM